MNAAPVRDGGEFVLYWMIAFRRLRWNFALDRALEWARELKKPLAILEALRCDYPWASDRLHRFAMQGMAEKVESLKSPRAHYFPYVEGVAGEGRGLFEALAQRACVVVTDEFPCFFLPRMVRTSAKRLSVRLETVDSNGLLPLRAAPHDFSTAYAFRRFLQNTLPAHLSEIPDEEPLSAASFPKMLKLPMEILQRWPAMSVERLRGSGSLSSLPIDHSVGTAVMVGGESEARLALTQFIQGKAANYLGDRNKPDEDGASGLSPYLHFGHISSHEIFAQLMKAEKWSGCKLALRANGSREGWWGVSKAAQAFLDQFITWRELGLNFCHFREDYERYESLPDWTKQTLAKHARDEREYVYSREEFREARTHDPLWNGAQRQLVREGRMHNYMRMLWGKKILEWTRKPQDALEIMIELNNRYAVDGRDPNSYSGIFWCLGRYDRPWGPERPVFGTIRYMSSQNTARKFRVKKYLRKYGDEPDAAEDLKSDG
jgi:deoxyribodipyrimidine photo-lyase